GLPGRVGRTHEWIFGWLGGLAADARHRFDPGVAFPAIGYFDQCLSRTKPEKHHHRIIHFLLGRPGPPHPRPGTEYSFRYLHRSGTCPGGEPASDHDWAPLVECTTAGICSD